MKLSTANPARRTPYPTKWPNDHAWAYTAVIDEDFDNIPNQYEPTAENLHKHRVIQPAQ